MAKKESKTTKIEQKIVDYRVQEPPTEPQQELLAGGQAPQSAQKKEQKVVQMHESVERDERLLGSTYKIKSPGSEHAMYVTINDIVLNEGTAHETRRPFEVFINSKNMEHFQWIVALTRLISAVFRKGGDATFLIDELKAVFDPKGGYFKKGGVFMPSLVAEIGYAIEDHMIKTGFLKRELDAHQQAYLKQKKAEAQAAEQNHDQDQKQPQDLADGFPAHASLCRKCNTVAVVMMEGCMTCLACGDSKCG
ncbi:MAG: NrdJb [Cellvibrionales bacterium]|nr:NrdJb [Cellvibrionales bacterium]